MPSQLLCSPDPVLANTCSSWKEPFSHESLTPETQEPSLFENMLSQELSLLFDSTPLEPTVSSDFISLPDIFFRDTQESDSEYWSDDSYSTRSSANKTQVSLSALDFLVELMSSSEDDGLEDFDTEEKDDLDDEDDEEEFSEGESQEEEDQADDGSPQDYNDDEGPDELENDDTAGDDQDDSNNNGDDDDQDGDEQNEDDEDDEDDEDEGDEDDDVQYVGTRGKTVARSHPQSGEDEEEENDEDDEDDYPEEDYAEEEFDDEGSIDLGDESGSEGAEEDDVSSDTQNRKRSMGGKVGNPSKKQRTES